DAALIYNYHRMHMAIPVTLPAPIAIFTLCSLDVRVAARAASLFLSFPDPATHPLTSPQTLIFSGGVGALTAGRFGAAAEASAFAAVARAMGVPPERIVEEPRSTNTGENVRFTHALLKERALLTAAEGEGGGGGGGGGGGPLAMPRGFILVQKPYMERRTYATFVKQWPENGDEGETVFCVTSPELEWNEYPDAENPRDLVINIMVGDLVRVRDYPARGFQIPQHIPPDVWAAAERLMAAGYTAHLP
ncbi:DUF218 domain-containing protein, partial [Lasiosphaeria miniovina]